LMRGLFFSVRGGVIDDLTKYQAFNSHRYFRASIGFSYSPGELPLSLW
jgi:hypothetical protein